MVLKVDRRKNLSSLSYNIERKERREDKTILQREKELIEKMNKDIKFLKSRFFYRFSKEEKKIMKERAFTIPLECWGFKKNE